MNTWRKNWALAMVALIPAANSGCGALDGQGSTDEAGDVAPKSSALWKASGITKWPVGSQGNADIRVCFEPGFSASQKALIRHPIENTWEKAALINFWDWTDCPTPMPTTNVVRIRLDPSIATGPNPKAGVSDNLNNTGQFGKSSGANVVKFSTSTVSGFVSVHEFGHVLGFTHETNEGTCDPRSGTTTDISLENQSDVQESVMDFGAGCPSAETWAEWDNATGQNISLGPWDVIGVQTLYGRKPAGAIVGLDGECLAAQNSTAGTSVIGWPCTTKTFDLWSRDQFTLKAQVSGATRCLDVFGGAVNPTGPTQIDSFTCSPSATSQQFSFTGVAWRAMGKRCVKAESSAAGAKLSIAKCDGSSLQKWDFMQSDRRVRLNGTNLCAASPSSSPALGAEMVLATCAASTNDTFAFNSGRLEFGTKCVSVSGGLSTPGQRMVLWDGCSSAPLNAEFTLKGPIHIMNQCVDMLGGAASDGVLIKAFPCTGQPSQTWEYFW